MVSTLGAGCGPTEGSDAGPEEPAPLFPADYAESYREVRNCRPNGGSHDFNQIRVLTDPAAFDAYTLRTLEFPVDSVVLKEEYDASDADCSGPVVQWTVMQRIADGPDEQLSWNWQRVDEQRKSQSENEPRCYGCHAACVAPDGYEYTCTVP